MSANPNLIVAGLKKEAVRGTAEILTASDYNKNFIDAEEIQSSSDHSVVGKSSNGSLINTAKSYSRTAGGTGATKLEIKASDTPTVKPDYFEALEVAGFKTGVIDAGTNDNYEAYYDGNPSCESATYETIVPTCTDGCSKKLRGSVIGSASIGVENAGAPVMLEGTVSGAFTTPTTTTPVEPVITDGDCVLGTGMTAVLGGTVVNVTNWKWNSNLNAVAVTDWSQSDKSNIAYYQLSDGGDPTLEFGAIPTDCQVQDFKDLVDSTISGKFVFENDDMLIEIADCQFTDIQDANESGVQKRNYTVKCGGITLQLK